MELDCLSPKHMYKALHYANMAASVDNIQPWQFVIKENNVIDIIRQTHIDPLPMVDVSIGAAYENAFLYIESLKENAIIRPYDIWFRHTNRLMYHRDLSYIEKEWLGNSIKWGCEYRDIISNEINRINNENSFKEILLCIKPNRIPVETLGIPFNIKSLMKIKPLTKYIIGNRLTYNCSYGKIEAETYFDLGRKLEKVWVMANQTGFGFQPFGSSIKDEGNVLHSLCVSIMFRIGITFHNPSVRSQREEVINKIV